MTTRVPVECRTPVDGNLIEAFWRYDDALLTNDVDELNALFADSELTFRVDSQRVLMGCDAIRAFRSNRSAPPTRVVERVFAQTIDTHTAIVTATTRPPEGTGSCGFQTQVWQHTDGTWRIAAAHVTQPTSPAGPILDASVWRCAGNPLVPASGAGPLSGFTVAVKDLFAIAGFAVGAGNPTFLAENPIRTETAPAVVALLDAGAAIAGIAQTDELAYSLDGANAHYGAPPNPRSPDGLPGGSSSGTASAVALGWATIGLGTDTAGSIRVPASLQGLHGLRTTHGLVPTDGMQPLAPSFDTVGVLAASADQLHDAASVLAPGTGGPPPRRTVVVPALTAIAAPDVYRDFTRRLDRWVVDGVLPPIEQVDLAPVQLDRWMRAFQRVQGAEAWRQHGRWVQDHPEALGTAVAERFAIAAGITDAQLAEAHRVLAEAREVLSEIVDASVLALPTCPAGAPSRTNTAEYLRIFRTSTLRLTTPASIAGLPAISIPVLATAQRQPVGLGLVGERGTDLLLIDIARHVAPA
ncbi:DUF3225 domain-containing protein [Rhodococcus sp. IEGM 248]|nr:DUF3225 domain-containing protein [Rhodococcus sp. IEGM 248]